MWWLILGLWKLGTVAFVLLLHHQYEEIWSNLTKYFCLVTSIVFSALFLSTDGWEKQASRVLHTSNGVEPDPPIVNHIEFHRDGIQLLTVNERQIAIYAAPKLVYLKQVLCTLCMDQILFCTINNDILFWNLIFLQLVRQESSHPITYATYSCNGHSLYVSYWASKMGVWVSILLQHLD